jgi:hypothetical protein
LPENIVTPAHGRFSRRLQAVLLDSIIFLLLMAAALSVATAMQSDNFGRILGYTFVTILVLYEPVLVPLTGGTVGHYAGRRRPYQRQYRLPQGRGAHLGKICARNLLVHHHGDDAAPSGPS